MLKEQEYRNLEQAWRELYFSQEEIALLRLVKKTERIKETVYPEEVDVAMLKRNNCLRMDRIDL